MLLRIEDKRPLPIYRQIMEQLCAMIDSQALRPGDPLPSTRQLADNLDIHRSTVATAYQELWALGYIELDRGRCPRVRERMRVGLPTDASQDSTIPWNTVCSDASSEVWDRYLTRASHIADPSVIDFSHLNLDSRLFPLQSFGSSLRQVMSDGDASLLGYGDSSGYRPLREWVCRHLQGHGISACPEEVLITNGTQNSIDLVLRLLTSPGASIAIESPTDASIIPLLRLAGLKIIEIPMLATGMDLSVLADIVQREQPALVYTIPSFQNPTGVSTSQEHREKLLAICMQHQIPILEDGFEEDMKYFGRAVLPIKSIDSGGVVLYCGTFSKVLFPGLRIGWLVAHRGCIDRLTAIRNCTSLASSGLLQAAIYDFCEAGLLDRHVSRMHRVFRKRMHTAIRVLRRDISSAWAEWEDPSGGYLVWLKLRPTPVPVPWERLWAKHGVMAALGDHFFASPQRATYLRLSISGLNEEEITEGVRRLAAALQEAYSCSNA